MSTIPANQFELLQERSAMPPALTATAQQAIYFNPLSSPSFLSDRSDAVHRALVLHSDVVRRLIVMAVILFSFVVGLLISHV